MSKKDVKITLHFYPFDLSFTNIYKKNIYKKFKVGEITLVLFFTSTQWPQLLVLLEIRMIKISLKYIHILICIFILFLYHLRVTGT